MNRLVLSTLPVWLVLIGHAHAGGDAGAAAPVFRSESAGLSWRLPADWEFVPVAELGLRPSPGVEMIGARTKQSKVPVALVMVADFTAVISGKPRESKPTDLADLEANARLAMRESRVQDVQVRPAPLLGTVGIRVTGTVGAADSHIDARLAYRGYRKVEFRCYYTGSDSTRFCDEAFAGIEVEERIPPKLPGETPRLLHLRDAEFGIHYDAPDDSWRAVGPRTGMNGAQAIWIWNKAGRQIDVGATDYAALPRQAVDESLLVTRLSEGFRRHGMTVKIKKSKLAGRPCFYLEMSQPTGDQQDLFVQLRGRIAYSVLVTAPTHDADLVSQAKAGLQIHDKESVRGGAARITP